MAVSKYPIIAEHHFFKYSFISLIYLHPEYEQCEWLLNIVTINLRIFRCSSWFMYSRTDLFFFFQKKKCGYLIYVTKAFAMKSVDWVRSRYDVLSFFAVCFFACPSSRCAVRVCLYVWLSVSVSPCVRSSACVYVYFSLSPCPWSRHCLIGSIAL